MTPPERSFFPSGEGDPVGLLPGEGLASGLALGAGVGVGVSSGAGVGVTLGDGLGEPFFLLLFFGDGDGELFGVGLTEAAGAGVGEAVGFGELVGFGVALAFGVAVGDALAFGEGVGVGELFFFFAPELFRFFGAGVGSKMLLILSPNDWALAAGAVKPMRHASAPVSRNLAARPINGQAPAGSLC